MSITKNLYIDEYYQQKNNSFNQNARSPSENELIALSQFAVLSDLPRDTLVYYMKEKLIQPAVILKNGYKYFRPEQLETIHFIKYMRRCGVRISEIRNLLPDRKQHDETEVLLRQQNELNEKLHELELSRRFLHQLDQFIDFTESHQQDVPFFAELEENEMYLTPVHFCSDLNLSCEAERFTDFSEKNKSLPKHLMCCRIPQNILLKGNFCEYMQQNAEAVDRESLGKRIRRPSGKYACVVHQGGNGTIKNTVMSLKDYIVREGCEPAGDAYVLNSAGYIKLPASSAFKYMVQIPVI